MTTYVPGSWLAIVTPRASALVTERAGVDSRAIADALRSRGLSGFVDSLASATGTTVTTLPAFAVAVAEEHGIRVAVRGEAIVTDALNSDVPALTGVGVTGWAEALWPTSHAVRLEVAGADTGEELWIVEGAVRAHALTWSLDDTAPTPSPVVQAAEVEPASAPVEPAVAQPAAQPVAQPVASPAAVPPILLTEVPPHITASVKPAVQEEAPVAESLAAADPTPPVADPDVASVAENSSDIDEVSHETLVATYDTMAPESQDAPYDTFFGALWGSDASQQRASEPPPVASNSQAEIAQPEPVAPEVVAPEPVAPEPVAPALPEVAPASAAPAEAPATSAPVTAAPPASAPAASAPVAPPPPPALGDHDGATISVAALRAMTAGGSENQAPPSVPTFATPEQLEKERRGRAVLSTGVQITLDKNIIVGRTPKASRVTGEMPHLVTVPSPSQDISRSHVEIRVEGTAVVAVDLNTTNGTVVRRGGAEPARLHPGEPFVLLNGDIIDLGDGVTVTMEDLP